MKTGEAGACPEVARNCKHGTARFGYSEQGQGVQAARGARDSKAGGANSRTHRGAVSDCAYADAGGKRRVRTERARGSCSFASRAAQDIAIAIARYHGRLMLLSKVPFVAIVAEAHSRVNALNA